MDVVCLVETWHDDGCVAVSRLHVDGYNVVDRPRPRPDRDVPLRANHDGVYILVAPGSKLIPWPVSFCSPFTFEVVTARLEVGQYRSVIIVIYRPCSQAVKPAFFTEMATVFNAIAMVVDEAGRLDQVEVLADRRHCSHQHVTD
jgi:hypothetical protein